MQLAAFTPFYRNHNQTGAIPQEPFVWDSVANASHTVRYALLPYWVCHVSYILCYNISLIIGVFPTVLPVRQRISSRRSACSLFWEFPNEPELFAVDRQSLQTRCPCHAGLEPQRLQCRWCILHNALRERLADFIPSPFLQASSPAAETPFGVIDTRTRLSKRSPAAATTLRSQRRSATSTCTSATGRHCCCTGRRRTR
jgi:hypothetical protein